MRRAIGPNESARSSIDELGEPGAPILTSNHTPTSSPVTVDPSSLNTVNQQPTHDSPLHSNPLAEQCDAFLQGTWLPDISLEIVDTFFPETAGCTSPAHESAIDPFQSSSSDQRHPINQSSANGMTDQDMDPQADFSQSTLEAQTSSSDLQYSHESHGINGVMRVNRTRSLSERRTQNEQIVPRRNPSRRTRSERNVAGTEEWRYLELWNFVDL